MTTVADYIKHASDAVRAANHATSHGRLDGAESYTAVGNLAGLVNRLHQLFGYVSPATSPHRSPQPAVDDGVPPNMVQRVMGHERASTTLDLYTRHTANTDRILAALSDGEDDDERTERP